MLPPGFGPENSDELPRNGEFWDGHELMRSPLTASVLAPQADVALARAEPVLVVEDLSKRFVQPRPWREVLRAPLASYLKRWTTHD